jgi:hypothetical protein
MLTIVFDNNIYCLNKIVALSYLRPHLFLLFIENCDFKLASKRLGNVQPSDHNCGRSNRDHPYQIWYQSLLNQLTRLVTISKIYG